MTQPTTPERSQFEKGRKLRLLCRLGLHSWRLAGVSADLFGRFGAFFCRYCPEACKDYKIAKRELAKWKS